MEILIYISGIFTAVLAVAIVSFRKTNKKYTSLLRSNLHNTNISSIRNAEVNERLDEMGDIVRVIQNDYVPNGDLSERIKNIDNILEEMAKKIAKDRSFTEKVQFDAGNNFQRLNDRINKMGQDPGLQSNY
tara:strand:+ start:2494 stop:2886 length:393 start_codon:yes stop_codon:yes gene_type:complete